VKLLSFNLQAAAATQGYHDYWRKAWRQVLPHPDKHLALHGFAEIARDFDVVGVQEADRGSLRAGFKNQPEIIAQACGFAHVYGQANREFGWLFSSGNAILSRQAGIAKNFALPGLLVPERAHEQKRSVRSGRGALMLQALGVRWINVHLALMPQVRMRQLTHLAAQLGDDDVPSVVFGDFNCSAESAAVLAFAHKLGLTPLKLGPSFPSWAPKLAIDLILISRHLRAVDAKVLPALVSDHRPVCAELVLR
jgi:endonuclease/exonuclease/phosphatase family metal-dependent hydrolase